MTPEQEEQVRRALAATARGEGDGAPLPPEVGDRLDALLADLSQARVRRDAPTEASPGTGARDELAARRERRWPQVLVAAATVAVIALAGGAVATGGFGITGSQGNDATVSSDSAAGSDGGGDSGSAGGSSGSGDQEKAVPESGDADAPQALTSEAGPFRLRAATLRDDVRRVARATTGADTSARAGSELGSDGDADCARPGVAAGQTLVDVLLDGARASLVLDDEPGADGTRAARVYSCDDPDRPVRETTIR